MQKLISGDGDVNSACCVKACAIITFYTHFGGVFIHKHFFYPTLSCIHGVGQRHW